MINFIEGKITLKLEANLFGQSVWSEGELRTFTEKEVVSIFQTFSHFLRQNVYCID